MPQLTLQSYLGEPTLIHRNCWKAEDLPLLVREGDVTEIDGQEGFCTGRFSIAERRGPCGKSLGGAVGG